MPDGQAEYRLPESRPAFPVRVIDVPYGKALVAAQDLQPGTMCEKFDGPDVEYDRCSDYDKTYVLYYQPKGSKDWKWRLPVSNARYANHSCDPNSYITDNQELVTKRLVREGEQITFVYNNGEDDEWWDPIWNFDCCCGAKKCQGKIDRYRKFVES